VRLPESSHGKSAPPARAQPVDATPSNQLIRRCFPLENRTVGPYLDAEVRDVAQCVVKAVGEIGGADHQCQFHNLPLIVEFSQLFEGTAANGSGAARDALGVQNRGFLLLVKQRAAVVELQRLDLFAGDSDPLRRSGVCTGSILAAVD
jgi:hypothetical protein